MWHTKMRFSAKCNSGRIAIQWFHIKYYLDYQYTKFQPYTFRVQKMCVFARYATLVPRLTSHELGLPLRLENLKLSLVLTLNYGIKSEPHTFNSQVSTSTNLYINKLFYVLLMHRFVTLYTLVQGHSI